MIEGRSDRRRRDTRDRLIRVATGLFRRRGVNGTGVQEICQRAGVTKGVFSHHFPGGKDELAALVVARNATDVELRFNGLGSAGAASVADAVRQVFASYGALLQAKGPDFGCPVAATVVDASSVSPVLRQAAHAAFAAWRAALRKVISSAAQTAAATVDVTPDLDALILAALEGAILLARADEDPQVVARVGRALGQLLAH